MLIIRLTRVGKKKQPQYRFIVSEKARDPWGKAREILGSYEPLRTPTAVTLNKERIEYWLSKGAQCSDTVWNLLVDQGVVKGEKRQTVKLSTKRKGKLGKKAEEAAAAAPAAVPEPAQETPVEPTPEAPAEQPAA
ncbi:30S ribosomal protein S16 [Candidatus Uhrbacteria bacterium]|nr:MAG: 30S ribosomal protein S16 [Candidatus Uhrbacteria bacterium]